MVPIHLWFATHFVCQSTACLLIPNFPEFPPSKSIMEGQHAWSCPPGAGCIRSSAKPTAGSAPDPAKHRQDSGMGVTVSVGFAGTGCQQQE